MAKDEPHKHEAKPPADSPKGEGKPEWANGLRQLYDSVVDEPLPDSFNDLLAKLDEDDKDETGRGTDDA